MNDQKNKKNDDFIYVEGNVGEHDLTMCNLLSDNYLIIREKVENNSFIFAWFLRIYISKRGSVYKITRLTSFRDNLCQWTQDT